MTLLIRDARPEDASTIVEFIRDLAEYEELSHAAEGTEDRVRETMFGPNPRVFCSIAEWGGEPAGLAIWFYNYSTFLTRHGIWLEDLFVAPEYRGKGIGRTLLKSLAQRCDKEGLGRLEWWVLDWNEPSIGFYRSLGAASMDDWTLFRLAGDALASLARDDR